MKCGHVIRSGPLHSSIKIGGGVSMGVCGKKVVPGMVVCAEHANQASLVYLVTVLTKEVRKLKKQKRVSA